MLRATIGVVVTVGLLSMGALVLTRSPMDGTIANAQALAVGDEGTVAEMPAAGAGARFLLRRPALRDPTAFSMQPLPSTEESRRALAYQFNAPIYDRPKGGSSIVGFVRRNTEVSVARWVPGDGCDGSWYEVLGAGYVCNTDGFVVDTEPTLSESLTTRPPRVETALPFRYAKATPGAPRFWKLPSPEDDQAARERNGHVESVKERLDGAYFVAVDRFVEDHGRRFVRTVRGRYLRESDIEPREPPRMHGELLASAEALPMAFVHRPSAPVYELGPETITEAGKAQKHARFSVDGVREIDGRTWVVSTEGHALPRGAVRLVEQVQRPTDVPSGEKWIHVNMAEQTLVAYEGDRPVLATLVSTGKEGYEPPRGVFRVHKKYLTRTMSGEDDVDGVYEVDQVPWTMYYWGSFALHGTYWHDEFGTVRSHGCTNIPPLDARWLFYWSPPELPHGWHGTIGRKGPWVYFS